MNKLAQAAEIERKFLVKSLPDLTGARASRIRQGYLTGPADSVEMRLRQKDDSYFLTLKSDGDVVRIERESEITAEQFAVFWPQTDGRRVEKTRWSGALPRGSRCSGKISYADCEAAPLSVYARTCASRPSKRKVAASYGSTCGHRKTPATAQRSFLTTSLG